MTQKHTPARNWPSMLIWSFLVVFWGLAIIAGFQWHKGQHPEQYDTTSHNLIGGKP